MKNTPFFSVIMPTFNHSNFLPAAVESVLNQIFEDYEIIICNDGSTDSTLQYLNSLYDHRNIKIINKPNGGTVSALNSALMQSTGEYICWLSSDDLFNKKKLMTHYDFHSKNKNNLMSIAPFAEILDNEISQVNTSKPDYSVSLIQLFFGNYINGLSVCANRNLYIKYGIFDQRFKYAQDVDRWYQFMKFEEPVYIEGEPLSYSNINSGHLVGARAWLYGILDIIKLLTSSVQKEGINAFFPSKYCSGNIPTLELVKYVLNATLNLNNIFFRYNLKNLYYELMLGLIHSCDLDVAYICDPTNYQITDTQVEMSQLLMELRNYETIKDCLGFYGHLNIMHLQLANSDESELVKKYFNQL